MARYWIDSNSTPHDRDTEESGENLKKKLETELERELCPNSFVYTERHAQNSALSGLYFREKKIKLNN